MIRRSTERLSLFYSTRIYPKIRHLRGTWRTKQILGNLALKFSPSKSFFAKRNGSDILIDTDDYVGEKLYCYGVHEPQVRSVLNDFLTEGDIVFEVGAHIGTHSLLIRDIIGEEGVLYSFEPDPENRKFLEKNLEKNDFDDVIVIEKALSNVEGEQKIRHRLDNTGGSTIEEINESEDYREYNISTVKLDRFMRNQSIDRVDFVKMDIEGSELKALKGADLSKVDKLLLEVHHEVLSREELKELYGLLEEGMLTDIEKDSDIENFDQFQSCGYVLWRGKNLTK